MSTRPTELSVELIDNVLEEKEAALAKEQAVLEDLKRVLTRMGYELVPAAEGKARRMAAAIRGRGRGRPRKTAAVSPASESVTESAAKMNHAHVRSSARYEPTE